MEKNNNGKVVAIVALIVAVVALSVGFAAFADTLNIAGTANVTAAGNAFDSENTNADLRYTGSPICYLTSDNNSPHTSYAAATPGSFSGDGDSWTGIVIPLGSSANSVTCEATVTNNSSYKAFLTALATTGGLSCSSNGTNAAANVAAVCSTSSPYATTLTVQIISNVTDSIIVHDTAANNTSTTGEINANGGTATVKVTLAYTGATIDDDVTITLPTITHDYASTRSGS